MPNRYSHAVKFDSSERARRRQEESDEKTSRREGGQMEKIVRRSREKELRWEDRKTVTQEDGKEV